MRKSGFLIILLLALTVGGLSAQETSMPGSGNGDFWRVRDGQRFIFIYRERDRAFARDLENVSEESYRIVCGYFGFVPNEKPKVILYGDQDSPAQGGFCGPFPLRIALSAATSYSPRTLLTHEFTHWMNAVRPTGFMHVAGQVFGRDISFLALGLEFHFVEGISSFLDGERADSWNEMLYKAPLLEERMWSFEQTWTGGASQPGALRIYLSGLLLTDYLYRHYGADAFARLHKRFADFPFVGDSPALREISGQDPRLVWADALREARIRFDPDARRPQGKILTPQDTLDQNSWILLQESQQGLLLAKTSLSALPEYGFYRPSAAQDQWRPIQGLRESVIGAAIDQAGATLVVSRVPDAFSQRDDEKAVADLWISPIAAASDGSLRVDLKRLTLHAQISRPAISPDGKNLYAVQRVSNEWRLVQVDTQSGQVTIILDGTQASGKRGEDCFSVLRVTVSPDGKTLGLLMSRRGQSDIALVAPDGSNLRWVSHDAASEYSPRFAPDGKLLFASDRENAIVLYALEADGKTINRVFRDRVGVWAGSWVDNDQGGQDFVYQSYSSQGYVLKSIDSSAVMPAPVSDFLTLSPEWLAKRDAIWQEMASLAPAEASPSPGPVKPIEGGAEDQSLVDIATPVYWLPDFGLGSGGFYLGAQTVAASVLGGNYWNLGLDWIPIAYQFTGQLGFGIDQPGYKLVSAAGLAYSVANTSGGPVYFQDRSVKLDNYFNLFAGRAPDNSVSRLDGYAGSSVLWRVIQNTGFDFISSLGLAPVFHWQVGMGLGFRTNAAAPANAVFGGSGFNLSGYVYARPLKEALGLAGNVQAGVQVAIGGTIIRLESDAALDSLGHGGDFVQAFSQSWPVADGPWRMDAGVSWRIPLGFDLTPVGQFSIEYSGLLLGISSGVAFSSSGSVQWDGYLVTRIEYYMWPLIHTAAVPVVAGIAWRFDPSAIGLSGNLLVYFGIYGQGLSTGLAPLRPHL